MSKGGKYSTVLVIIIGIIIGLIAYFVSDNDIINSDGNVVVNHAFEEIHDIISDEQHFKLKRLFENLDTIPLATKDLTNEVYPHFGEAINATKDDKCNKRYLMYSPKLNSCIFPGRLDIAKHYVITGGFNGWKERYNDIILRLLVFQNYQFKALSKDEFIELFNLPKFKNAVNNMCGKDHPYFRPYQVSLILQLPGMNVASHLDIPYFIGASRYQFPQWLLLVMQDSGLFKDRRLPQVQALVYVNDWNLTKYNENEYGGQFYLYPNGIKKEPKIFKALAKSGVFCDGSEAVHGSATFKPNIKPLKIDKDIPGTYIKYMKHLQKWQIYVNNTETEYTYNWEDIRTSIAYRGWCFKTENEMNEYDPKYYDKNDLNLDKIINILKHDLVKKKYISIEKLNKMDGYELGLYLIKQYIQLPYPNKGILKYNYCLLFDVLPQYKILNYISKIFCH